MDGADFRNRLAKNAAKWLPWARREGVAGVRLFDRDIPEWRVVVEWWAGRVQVIELPGRGDRRAGAGTAAERRELVLTATAEVLEVPREQVILKTREPMAWGMGQHEALGESGEQFVVEEHGLKFRVNLRDRIDPGLFLDHRLTRRRVREEARGKRVLNLFCYTGAFSVAAAAGGARSTTSVDLSNTALARARDNLALNGFTERQHECVRSDVLRWVKQQSGRHFDVAVLDPPSRSTSKAMAQTFEVQRHHAELITDVLGLLAPGGVLWFSTNYRSFEMDPAVLADREHEETTPNSIPPDFRDRTVHRCWRIQS